GFPEESAAAMAGEITHAAAPRRAAKGQPRGTQRDRGAVGHAGCSSNVIGPWRRHPVVSSHKVGFATGGSIATSSRIQRCCTRIGSAQPSNHAPLEHGSTQYFANFWPCAW